MNGEQLLTNPVFKNGDPLDIDTALANFERSIRMKTRVCIPVCVYDYDRENKIVTVVPLIKFATRKKSLVFTNRDPFSVSVLRTTHGGFSFEIPIYRGDTGWVIASDSDTMKLKEDGSLTSSVLSTDRETSVIDNEYQQEPQYSEFHFLEEGFFIPDSWTPFEGSRCKDVEGGVPKDALYLGTSFDTKDKYQGGGEYEKNASCSLIMEKSGALTLANSDGSGNRVSVRLEDGTVKIGNENGWVSIDTGGNVVIHGSTIKLEGRVIQ